jgi:hypothetical protein
LYESELESTTTMDKKTKRNAPLEEKKRYLASLVGVTLAENVAGATTVLVTGAALLPPRGADALAMDDGRAT